MTYGENSLLEVIKALLPAEEHFLKKYLLEHRLTQELQHFTSPQICELLGFPFKTNDNSLPLPLLSFFLRNLVAKFPFIASNTPQEQQKFWQSTVQPFICSINTKSKVKLDKIPSSHSKSIKINKKLLSGLLIFFNSVFVTEKDMIYLSSSHLKSESNLKLGKLNDTSVRDNLNLSIDDFSRMKFQNDISINIVSVRKIGSVSTSTRSWFGKVTTGSPRHNFEFVIQITNRDKLENVYTYTTHYISRPFNDFHKLEKCLKDLLPGIMSTKVFPIGKKLKGDDGANGDDFDDSSSTISTDSDDSKLFKEKQRLALRGWIIALTEFPEVIHSSAFQTFITDKSLIFNELTPSDLKDHENRIAHERHIISTQQEFQNQTVTLMADLSVEFNKLKNDLIKNPDALIEFYEILGHTADVKNSKSPIIKLFNNWAKIEVAATFYQWFLGSDRSAPVLAKCVKFNRLIPHTLIYNVLKYTNPVKIVGRMLDLLFLPIPSFSLPKWGKNEADETSKAGARNMISMAFVMLLEDDLNGYEKELKVLENEVIPAKFAIYIERIKAYFELPVETSQDIQDESYAKSQDLLLTVLTTDLISPRLNKDDAKNYEEILYSYENFKSVGENESEDIHLYVSLKQYWQLVLNTKNKEFFKLLWQDAETTKFIKGFMVLFYKPLLELMNKAQMHVSYRNTQKFMDDILHEMVKLNKGEKYYLDPLTLMNRIVEIITKHENNLWLFVSNIYSKDENELFVGLVTWISRFLDFSRLKYQDLDSVDLKLDEIDYNIDIDNTLFLRQLKSKTERIIRRRQLFKEYVDIKSELTSHTTQEQLDKNWDSIHEKIMGDTGGISAFGVDIEDIQDFNDMNHEEDFNNEEVGLLERELKQKLFELDQELDIGTSELDKLDEFVKSQLVRLIENLEIKLNSEEKKK